jgi:hypothetical protein
MICRLAFPRTPSCSSITCQLSAHSSHLLFPTAFLASHQGTRAAGEFQKILDWPGVVVNEPIAALAHLGLARSYDLAGDASKSRAAYQDFLTLWKYADPDVPVLIAAKAEYAKLQQRNQP